ncbi:F-box protein At3g07870-like [Mercurialis annua]|uniref:F-box protein At3g07870-like n=1 Tax=Mercurialis annua TaxID=3986 RepID=UPI00215F209F|nr:F-box protein At3g07870-like [Mercurialis annua]
MVLPETITEDILSRLDVKSILRSKSVCKTWCHLISTLRFQQLHRSRSGNHPLFLYRSTQFFYNPLPHHPFSYAFVSVDASGAVRSRFTVKVDDPIKLLVSSSCGLVCFASQFCIYVCNPATRQILELPPCPPRTSIAGFGFGYLDSINGCKVVRFISHGSRGRIECSVATLSAANYPTSWRVLNEGCPYLVEEFNYPVLVNDHIYWKIDRKTTHQPLRRSNDYILCFNLRQEKFSVVTHPPDWRDDGNSLHLADLGGMLCMVEITSSQVVVWMLKDHRSSFWYKGGLIAIQGIIDRRLIGEVKGLKNGEIIFSSFANILLFYDTKKKTFRHVKLPFRSSEFGIYWETLFFPRINNS